MKLTTMTAAFAVLLLTAPLAEAQTTMVLSNDASALGVKGQTFEKLKSEIEARLGDEITVEVHHSGALFDQKTQLQGLQLGSASLVAPTSGIYTPIAPGIGVMTLPFMLTNAEAVVEAWQDETVRSAYFPELEKKNIQPVAIWMNGPRELSYRGDAPILTPEDIKGVKIRVQSVPSDIEAFKIIGANPVSMSWGEVPSALQQGVIDAIEPTPNAVAGGGMIDVVDQMTKFGYQYSYYMVSVNKMWWDGLPEEERSQLSDAIDAATQWNWENAAKDNEDAYQALIDAGKQVHELDDAQKAAWAEAMQPVWEEYGTVIAGEEVMNRLREIAEVSE